MDLVLGIIFSIVVAGLMLTHNHGIWPWKRSSGRVSMAGDPTAQVQGFAATATAPAPTEAGPYGAGSLAPLADGSMPAGHPIKGNADSMLYHRPDSRSYDVTVAEVWFDSPERAEAAGFTAAKTHPKT